MILEFIELLIARTAGRILPTKFIMFSMVGAFGVLIHLAVLTSLFGGIPWLDAAMAGIIVGATWNYAITALFTWPDVA